MDAKQIQKRLAELERFEVILRERINQAASVMKKSKSPLNAKQVQGILRLLEGCTKNDLLHNKMAASLSWLEAVLQEDVESRVDQLERDLRCDRLPIEVADDITWRVCGAPEEEPRGELTIKIILKKKELDPNVEAPEFELLSEGYEDQKKK